MWSSWNFESTNDVLGTHYVAPWRPCVAIYLTESFNYYRSWRDFRWWNFTGTCPMATFWYTSPLKPTSSRFRRFKISSKRETTRSDESRLLLENGSLLYRFLLFIVSFFVDLLLLSIYLKKLNIIRWIAMHLCNVRVYIDRYINKIINKLFI